MDLSDLLDKKIQAALDLADNTDGAHHKQWTIDQIVRVLTGDAYKQWVISYESCGNVDCARHHDGGDGATDCDSGYNWDEGIAP